jgi:hypothetical protein
MSAWSRAIAAGAEDPEALWAKIEVVEVAEQEGQSSGQTAKPAPADPSRWP